MKPRHKRAAVIAGGLAALSLVSLTRAPSMATPMLWGMLIMVLAFWMYAIAAALARVRNIILERERHTDWVKNAVE